MKRGQTDYSFVVGLNKPKGITSHAALSCLKNTLGESRIGHAGTLDPNASGVLVALVGSATRLNKYIVSDNKSYIAEIHFGITTDTDDSDGHIIENRKCPTILLDKDYAYDTLKQFIGEISQLPPSYSAIKQSGIRAYEKARRGENVLLQPRNITVHSASLIDIFKQSANESQIIWQVQFDVSKGTYIRSLARDIGIAANCGAHLSNLKRTRSGIVDISNCVDCDSNINAIFDNIINPIKLLNMPCVKIKNDSFFKLNNGNKLCFSDIENHSFNEPYLTYDNLQVALINNYGLKAIYRYVNTLKCFKPECVFQKEIILGKY